ncbi:hypothetical protein RF55_15993 [Lasius niger]|uniref:Uncharacterized protein n=1 Tax=Lasius niger TaxID=67767 RepID=A0A0J7MYE2_LASNI|nr:hypothetical protein RF55_15993 [Lasius niger]
MNVGKPHLPKDSASHDHGESSSTPIHKRNIHQVFIEFGGERAKRTGREDAYDEDYCFLITRGTEEHEEETGVARSNVKIKMKIEMNRVGLRRIPRKVRYRGRCTY